MKLFFTRLTCLLLAVLSFSLVDAQQRFFRDIPESAVNKAGQKRTIVPEKYRTLQLDTAAMLPFLRSLPLEKNITDRNATPIISLPMPDGSVARFHVWESPIFEQSTAPEYAGIKTFTGQGIDDRTATIKFDWTGYGFHAMIFSSVTGDILMDPYIKGNLLHYISYFKADYKKKHHFEEQVIENANELARDPNQVLAGPCVGTQLKTYRLALACTGEYAQAIGANTVPLVLSEMTTAMNRVNGVYETELSVRMIFVANETSIIFLNPATDPFLQDSNGQGLLDESQRVIDSAIQNPNYDIGHIFSSQGGGIASVNSVCQTGIKARGVTGTAGVSGDGFYIDFVAHEMGHQFGARHSFNNANSCGVTASDQNGEPGSGVTIMAYAGVCASDNIANNSIAYFHGVSFDKISPYISSGGGSSCAAVTATGNSLPVVNAGSDYTIPRGTPFILNGTATDANGDAITYSWEQVDVGGPNGASTSPSGNAPLFRSFAPQATGQRYFPKLSDVNGNVTTIGERLPNYARSMKFRLTARDNRAGGGGVCFDETTITVSTDTFAVTYPTATNITWYANDFQTVTWNASGTAGAPINCANVMIQLSTNGGSTYPITLLASTPNDGSAEIQVPTNLTSQGRVRVMALGNVFYDISNSNFRILTSPTATFSFNNPAPTPVCSNSGVATLRTGSLGSFSTAINLSATGNPVGTTVSFGTNPLTPGGSTTVTLNNTGSLAPGTYTITVTGVAGAVTKTRDIQFVVTTGLAAPALSAPAADATGVNLQPSFNWAAVGGATSYVLELSTAADFSANLQRITNITAAPYVFTGTLADNTVYYWRMRSANTCEGTPGTARKFKTGVLSCWTSIDTPKIISSSGTPTVTSTITIPAEKGYTITDLNVTNLAGTHGYVGELTFTLTGPNNVTVTLLDQVCAPYSDFNITLDDAALTGVSCPMNVGAVSKPSGLLSAFNGINCAGTWTLTIQDRATNEGGTLTGWGLNINGTSATGCSYAATPLATIYTFTGTGNWNLASNWSGNTVPPNPLPAGAAIVINHSAGGNCTLNTAQTISPGATLTVNTGKNLIVPGNLTIQ